ncbi:hypothetical protein MPH_12804 [Macrophomina phaseolina MS6]|uniref:DUF6594 domain-containing protein n=1 Tax=Macrophomina phaseolina (strain MS6) TaxID=1126212 RepID=K2RJA6_MACPH|nr:hypothetical protein MPH_12804 [Macrophomina phaseolina MS6]
MTTQAGWQQETRNGYPELASVMGPHREMALFKRFAALSARSLLYRQVELLDLEEQFNIQTNLDRESELPFHKNARALLRSKGHPVSGKQWEMVVEIREKLKEYHGALLQQAQVNKLQDANEYDLSVLRGWLRQREGGNNFLSGLEDKPWRDDMEKDLVSLSNSSGRNLDYSTRWAAEKFVPWLYGKGLQHKKPLSDSEKAGLVEWRDGSYRTASRILGVLTSILMPSVAIITLYFIHNMLARIFAAIGFSVVFSAALALLTTARPTEIVGATAAFGSVQVVFIGSTSMAQ